MGESNAILGRRAWVSRDVLLAAESIYKGKHIWIVAGDPRIWGTRADFMQSCMVRRMVLYPLLSRSYSWYAGPLFPASADD